MSGFPTRPDDNGPGITSQQTKTTAPFRLGTGAFKEVIFAQHADAKDAEFSYALLEWAGAPPKSSNYYYAIVAVADFSASRLLSELRLQFHFSKVEIATWSDGTKVTLSPKIFALRIKNKWGEFSTHYGEGEIIQALASLPASSAGDKYDFIIAMERVNYDTNTFSVKTPEDAIDSDPNKLISLINAVLKQGVILTDIKVRNLSVKCSSSYSVSCELGVIDLDKQFVADVTGWNLLVNLGLTDAVHANLAKQYMVLMVCFVGLTNGLAKDTKIELLKKVGLLSQNGQTYQFNTAAINKMLTHPVLKSQIKHYLVGNYADTDNAAKEIKDELILNELFGFATRDSSNSYSSSSGGKSRRKHKKTRRRRPKSKKTRRIRSLRNHNLTR